MGRLAPLVVLLLLALLAGCAQEAAPRERPEEGSGTTGKVGRVELSESMPAPEGAQLWRPPPVWLVAQDEATQANYDGFCELDICIGAAPPEQRRDAPATVEVDAREEVLVVVGSDRVREISVGVKGWDDEPDGPPDDPSVTGGSDIPYYMRKLDSPPRRSEGEQPVVERASGGATTAFKLASTGRKGDRLLTVFLRANDGSNSAVYHWRLNPGEEGENPPPEEKEFPGDLVEVAPDRETETRPQRESARKLAASVESFPFDAAGTRIEAGEGYLWMLGAAGEGPGAQYPQEQYRPEVTVEDGVVSSSLAARAADEAVGPPGGTALLKVAPGTREVLFSASVPGFQAGLEVSAGAAWVATEEGVTRLDPGTGEVVAEIPVDGSPTRMASGKDGLWVSLYDDTQNGRVVRVDPATNEVAAEIETPGIAESVAVDGETGDVWMVALDQTKGFTDYENNQLVRVDPETAEISQRLKVEGGVADVVAGNGQVWVSNINGELSRIDPGKGRVASIVGLDPGQGPYHMEIGAGSLWAASVGTVWRVDLASGRPLGSAKLGEGRAEDLAVDDEGNVWTTGMGTLTRIAPG